MSSDEDLLLTLAPLDIGPLGLSEEYTRHQTPFALKIRERKLSVTGDDYEITTPDNQLFLSLKGKVNSWHSRKFLYDSNGNLILTIKNKIWSLYRHFYIFVGDSYDGREPAVNVHGNPQVVGSNMTITFQNAVGSHRDTVVLESNSNLYKAKITCNGQTVARVERKFLNAGQLLMNLQTYELTVAPGVDVALIAAICVCIDESDTGES